MVISLFSGGSVGVMHFRDFALGAALLGGGAVGCSAPQQDAEPQYAPYEKDLKLSDDLSQLRAIALCEQITRDYPFIEIRNTQTAGWDQHSLKSLHEALRLADFPADRPLVFERVQRSDGNGHSYADYLKHQDVVRVYDSALAISNEEKPNFPLDSEQWTTFCILHEIGHVYFPPEPQNLLMIDSDIAQAMGWRMLSHDFPEIPARGEYMFIPEDERQKLLADSGLQKCLVRLRALLESNAEVQISMASPNRDLLLLTSEDEKINYRMLLKVGEDWTFAGDRSLPGFDRTVSLGPGGWMSVEPMELPGHYYLTDPAENFAEFFAFWKLDPERMTEKFPELIQLISSKLAAKR